jgi:hypothetical protein
VNRELAVFKHLFRKVIEWKPIDENPARCVKILNENNGRSCFIAVEECHVLIAICPTETLWQFITLPLNIGMSKGEILSLKWENVNLRD